MKQELEREGYLVIRNLIDETWINRLREATGRVVEKGRSGEWPHVRVVGKQFPPWEAGGPDIWGAQHIMDDKLNEPIFREFYAGDELTSAVRNLLECNEDEICMELMNLLLNPKKDWNLGWHRDDIDWTADEKTENERLKISMGGCQWNLALYPESCLIVVPRSHIRVRTAVERAATPYQELPGEIYVHLNPGDIVFYNNNILHRAHYPASMHRQTLHGSHGRVGHNTQRASNILQHGTAMFNDYQWTGRIEKWRKNLLNVGTWTGKFSHKEDVQAS